MSRANQDLHLSSEDIGKKVYEIEQEITFVIKTQVIAKDDDDAFNKWLDCSETKNCEDYQAKDNGSDVVNSWAKEYSQLKGTTLIGTIQLEDKDDDQAFNKWLECNETINSEGYNAKHNGNDIVNSYGKEYSELKGTTLIGTIQKEDEKDEDSLLEVAYG